MSARRHACIQACKHVHLHEPSPAPGRAPGSAVLSAGVFPVHV